MGKYVKGKDGKFAGSIGDGKTSIPTPSNTPRGPRATTPPAAEANPSTNYNDMLTSLHTWETADPAHTANRPTHGFATNDSPEWRTQVLNELAGEDVTLHYDDGTSENGTIASATYQPGRGHVVTLYNPHIDADEPHYPYYQTSVDNITGWTKNDQ